MARPEIIDKLQIELALPLRRESQVVYIVAEIRKCLEHFATKEERDTWGVLEFFCNWALHIKIDRKSQADSLKTFFSAFDLKTGMSIEECADSQFFKEIMHLAAFRRELQRFLSSNGLPTAMMDEQINWLHFLYLYSGVVAESPLEYAKGDLLPDEVKSLIVTRLEQPGLRQKLVKFEVTLRNGDKYHGGSMYRLRHSDEYLVLLDEACQM